MPRILKTVVYILVLAGLATGGWFFARNRLTERAYQISREAGLALLEEGSYAEAIPQLEASLDAARHLNDSEGERLDEALEDLAEAHGAQGNYVQTQHLYFEALSRRVEKHGPVHPKVAEAFTNLGHSYELQASYEAAEGMYNQAIDVWSKLHRSEDPDSVPAYLGLARVKEHLGHYIESAKSYEHALKIEQRRLGEDHPDLAGLLRRYGATLEKAGEPAQALVVLNRAQRLAPSGTTPTPAPSLPQRK